MSEEVQPFACVHIGQSEDVEEFVFRHRCEIERTIRIHQPAFRYSRISAGVCPQLQVYS